MRKVDGEDEDIQDTKHNTLVCLMMIGLVIGLLLCLLSILGLSYCSQGYKLNTRRRREMGELGIF